MVRNRATRLLRGRLVFIEAREFESPPAWSRIDSEDTMRFSAMTGVRPMTETFPLEKIDEAYERMMSNKARFRVVITTGN